MLIVIIKTITLTTIMTECLVCFNPINKLNPLCTFDCSCSKQPEICKKCYTSWELENSKTGKITSCPHCRQKTTLTTPNKSLLYGIEITTGMLNLQLKITKPIPDGMFTPATQVKFENNRHCYSLGLQQINITNEDNDGKNIQRIEFTTINSITSRPIRINLDLIYKYIIQPRIFGKKRHYYF